MTRARRTAPEVRKEHLLEAAIQLSKEIGYNRITRDAIAEIAGTSSTCIAKYWPRMAAIRNAVVEAAIERGILEIIAQGLALNHPRALCIDPNVKGEVSRYILNLAKT
jgi:AcrR family transcriptional regulator